MALTERQKLMLKVADRLQRSEAEVAEAEALVRRRQHNRERYGELLLRAAQLRVDGDVPEFKELESEKILDHIDLTDMELAMLCKLAAKRGERFDLDPCSFTAESFLWELGHYLGPLTVEMAVVDAFLESHPFCEHRGVGMWRLVKEPLVWNPWVMFKDAPLGPLPVGYPPCVNCRFWAPQWERDADVPNGKHFSCCKSVHQFRDFSCFRPRGES